MSKDLDQQDAQELDTALSSLDAALADASKAVGTIRGKVQQFAALAAIVQEMDEAMARARSSLSAPPASASSPTLAPPLRAVPAQPQSEREPVAAQPDAVQPEPLADASPAEGSLPQPIAPREDSGPGEAATEPSTPEGETIPEAAVEQPVNEAEQSAFAAQAAEAIGRALPPRSPTTVEAEAVEAETVEAEKAEADAGSAVSHCLRLGVSSKTGSLDLKAVDGSVSENPAVVDVALLDYDGRQATLKLWINNAADPHGVREALLASLRRRLGDEQDAEVRIDFEEGSAA